MSEANNNLAIWGSVQATDPRYTKNFSKSGGFRGTSINATWLAKRATQTFGPMGIGWGVKILDESIMDGADGDKIHRVKIQLWYIWNGQRGEIEHFGLTTFVGRNKNGAFTDEEAAKKSLTDAMTKSLSLLGFASDVHLGMYDDNKYVNAAEAHFTRKEKEDRAERSAAKAAETHEAEAKATEAKPAEAEKADQSNEKPESESEESHQEGQSDEGVSEEVSPPVEQDHDDKPEAPKGEFDGFTEEQMDIIMKIDLANEISSVTELMTSPEVQKVLRASDKVDQTKIRLHGTKRLKELGWPAKRPKESLGEKNQD